jgi:hypothetical protein
MHPIIVVVGPTASGKSDLALSLAERFNGEIVNYDSVQVFRGLDIGSAKPSPAERQRVPHHMIDIRDLPIFSPPVTTNVRHGMFLKIFAGAAGSGAGRRNRVVPSGSDRRLIPGPDSLHAFAPRGWRRLQKLAAGNTFTACCNVSIRVQPKGLQLATSPRSFVP